MTNCLLILLVVSQINAIRFPWSSLEDKDLSILTSDVLSMQATQESLSFWSKSRGSSRLRVRDFPTAFGWNAISEEQVEKWVSRELPSLEMAIGDSKSSDCFGGLTEQQAIELVGLLHRIAGNAKSPPAARIIACVALNSICEPTDDFLDGLRMLCLFRLQWNGVREYDAFMQNFHTTDLPLLSKLFKERGLIWIDCFEEFLTGSKEGGYESIVLLLETVRDNNTFPVPREFCDSVVRRRIHLHYRKSGELIELDASASEQSIDCEIEFLLQRFEWLLTEKVLRAVTAEINSLTHQQLLKLCRFHGDNLDFFFAKTLQCIGRDNEDEVFGFFFTIRDLPCPIRIRSLKTRLQKLALAKPEWTQLDKNYSPILERDRFRELAAIGKLWESSSKDYGN